MPPPTNVKAQQAILALLDEGGTRSFGEVCEVLPLMSASAVRAIIHKLVTDCEVDIVRLGEDSRFACYRRAEARRPFLLADCWQTEYPAADAELHA